MSIDAAWRDFAQRMRSAGEKIAEVAPTDDRLRAEGFRYLSRLQVFAQQWFVEFSDPTHPVFFNFGDEVTKWGGPNVDNQYLRAKVEASGRYRISGNTNGVPEMLISVHDGEMVWGKTAVLAERTLADIDVDADGSFEILLGGDRNSRNWIPLHDGADIVLIRQFIGDWLHDGIAEAVIERIDPAGQAPPRPPDAGSLTTALDQAARWVKDSAGFWRGHWDLMAQLTPVNAFTPPSRPPGAAENMLIGACMWDLGDDDVVLVECNPPAGATYWSFQCINPWYESLDAANHVSSLNNRQMQIDEDGKFRIALGPRDPGIPNWLDTSGYRTGMAAYRWVNTTDGPAPTSQLLSIADLDAHLPPFTPRVSDTDRATQIRQRRLGMARRFRR